MSPGDTEKTKLLANALDRASTACFTVGIATPVAGYMYNIASFGTAIELWRLALGLVTWLLAALALHFLARRTLSELDRND